MTELVIDGARLAISDVAEVARRRRAVAIAGAVWPRLDAARAVVELYLEQGLPAYGLNTGLGGNLGHRLPPEEIAAFQVQLIRGRAVAVGPPLPAAVVRAALLARANGIARGASGVTRPVLAMLVELLNRGVAPIVPSRGSIGAADLAPMAHVGLVLLGLGEAELEGERLPGGEALRRAGLAPLQLGAKDALGLINANAITVGHAALVLDDARRLLLAGIAAAALACEGYGANLAAFDARRAALARRRSRRRRPPSTARCSRAPISRRRVLPGRSRTRSPFAACRRSRVRHSTPLPGRRRSPRPSSMPRPTARRCWPKTVRSCPRATSTSRGWRSPSMAWRWRSRSSRTRAWRG